MKFDAYILLMYTITTDTQTDTMTVFIVSESDNDTHFTIYSNLDAAQQALDMLQGLGIIREMIVNDKVLLVKRSNMTREKMNSTNSSVPNNTR